MVIIELTLALACYHPGLVYTYVCTFIFKDDVIHFTNNESSARGRGKFPLRNLVYHHARSISSCHPLPASSAARPWIKQISNSDERLTQAVRFVRSFHPSSTEQLVTCGSFGAADRTIDHTNNTSWRSRQASRIGQHVLDHWIIIHQFQPRRSHYISPRYSTLLWSRLESAIIDST